MGRPIVPMPGRLPRMFDVRRALLVAITLAGFVRKPAFGQVSGGPMASGIGGPFALVNGDGRSVTDRDLRGLYLLVFFGYTNCPDLCPTTLYKIARLLKLAAASGVKLRAVFITIDPARDTPAVVGAYTRLFSPDILGLSSTQAAIGQAEAAYHVFVGPRDPQTGAIAHSALIYLMGPDGRFITVFPDSEPADALAATIMAYRSH